MSSPPSLALAFFALALCLFLPCSVVSVDHFSIVASGGSNNADFDSAMSDGDGAVLSTSVGSGQNWTVDESTITSFLEGASASSFSWTFSQGFALDNADLQAASGGGWALTIRAPVLDLAPNAVSLAGSDTRVRFEATSAGFTAPPTVVVAHAEFSTNFATNPTGAIDGTIATRTSTAASADGDTIVECGAGGASIAIAYTTSVAPITVDGSGTAIVNLTSSNPSPSYYLNTYGTGDYSINGLDGRIYLRNIHGSGSVSIHAPGATLTTGRIQNDDSRCTTCYANHTGTVNIDTGADIRITRWSGTIANMGIRAGTCLVGSGECHIIWFDDASGGGGVENFDHIDLSSQSLHLDFQNYATITTNTPGAIMNMGDLRITTPLGGVHFGLDATDQLNVGTFSAADDTTTPGSNPAAQSVIIRANQSTLVLGDIYGVEFEATAQSQIDFGGTVLNPNVFDGKADRVEITAPLCRVLSSNDVFATSGFRCFCDSFVFESSATGVSGFSTVVDVLNISSSSFVYAPLGSSTFQMDGNASTIDIGTLRLNGPTSDIIWASEDAFTAIGDVQLQSIRNLFLTLDSNLTIDPFGGECNVTGRVRFRSIQGDIGVGQPAPGGIPCIIAGRGEFQTDAGDASLHVSIGSDVNERANIQIAGDASIHLAPSADDFIFIDNSTIGASLAIYANASGGALVREDSLGSLVVGGTTTIVGQEIELRGTNSFSGALDVRGTDVFIRSALDVSFSSLEAPSSLFIGFLDLYDFAGGSTGISATILAGASWATIAGANVTKPFSVDWVVEESIDITGEFLVQGGLQVGTAANSTVVLECGSVVMDSGSLQGTGTLRAPGGVADRSSGAFNSVITGGSDGAIGVLTIEGNVTANNTVVLYDVDGLSIDQVLVLGSVDLVGGSVTFVNQSSSEFPIGSTITLLNATGGITGQWDNAPQDTLFEFSPTPPPTPLVQYRANRVDIDFTSTLVFDSSEYQGEVVEANDLTDYSSASRNTVWWWPRSWSCWSPNWH